MFFLRFFIYTLKVAFVTGLLSACVPEPITVTEHPADEGARDGTSAKVVFIAGPDSHGAGEHEHTAGSKLLANALRARYSGISTVNVTGGWPENADVFEDARAIVIYCDGGRGHLINKHLSSFNQLVAEGVGVIALHYGVEVPKGSASADAMLAAIGGYFETDWSVNPHWNAEFTKLPDHPIAEGISPFSVQDEWYFNMRFQSNMKGVTPILSAIAPDSTMERRNGAHSGNETVRQLVAAKAPQVTAWAYERENGGRGFGFTGGHFHHNWQNDQQRNLLLNAIVWTMR